MAATTNPGASALLLALNAVAELPGICHRLTIYPSDFDFDVMPLVAAWVEEHRTAENRMRLWDRTHDTGRGTSYRAVAVYRGHLELFTVLWPAVEKAVEPEMIDGDVAPTWRPTDEMAVTCG